ncbi:hypothetical protein J41TS12_49320 [Paenibacillus antibioticophila]|uniref:Polymer-forming cytoskeletal protein n=1 Tax=Paenibacillus antibioticophila TaxID=1274374 RepID=A0A919XVI7_9BACL|nr:polymer-forming cytoskeletal protein [Paenibacillus antibioticophila]GIO40071.1 hypothetical protein J41TS12_49320 [Paenibacillus antibioticophila]
MFKSNKAAKVDPNTTDTLIGEGSVFEGKIKSAAGVRVEGQIIGDIECEGDVTIGEKGVVQSNIFARNVIIAGTVNGNIQARSKLSITAKGKLFGNMSAASISIEEGSIFEGTSRMAGGTGAPVQDEASKKEAAAASELKTETQSAPPASKGQNTQKEEVTFKSW